MSSLEKLKDQLEYLFMRVIISGLKGGTLTIPEAKNLAQEFLKIEPFLSIEDAHTKIDIFVATYPKFSVLKEYANIYYDEDKIEQKMETMRGHLKRNNIDEALNTIK